jgi:phosphoribosylanthranilate isomerase
MALKTFVKVSGINNLSDARYCAGMEVNELGFEIEVGSSNYVDPQVFKEIKGWLSGVDFVGEITTNNAAISELIADYEVDLIQIESIEQIDEALTTGLKVCFGTNNKELAQKAWDISEHRLAYILFDGTDYSIEEIDAIAKVMPIVLASGFDAETVNDRIESSIKGISIRGGNEIRPGYKDFDEMADILEALEIDDLA